jgi:hypothetical protein
MCLKHHNVKAYRDDGGDVLHILISTYKETKEPGKLNRY